MKKLILTPVFLVMLITTVYALSVVSGVPLDDEWRWFTELLLPFKEGKISFLRYVTGEYSLLSHSQIMAIAFLWLGDKYWMSDFSYFAYCGLIFYLFSFCLFGLYLKKSAHQSSSVIVLASLISACGYFCTTTDFPWLLVVFEYVYYFFAVLLLIAFDFYVRKKLSIYTLISCVLFNFLFADTIGMAAAFTVLCVFFILCVLRQESFYRLGVLILVVAVVLCLEVLLLGYGLGVGGHSRPQTILALLNNPVDILSSFFSIFAQPLIDMTIFKAIFGEDWYRIFQMIFGVIMFQLVMFTSILWFKRRGHEVSILPVLLISFSLLSWVFILVSRYLDFGVYVMDAQRYVRNFTLIYVGLGLMFLLMKHDKKSKRLLVVSFFCICGSYAFSTIFQYKNIKSIDTYFANAKIEMRKHPADSSRLGQYIGRCNNGYCDKAINYLRQNQMSVFKSE